MLVHASDMLDAHDLQAELTSLLAAEMSANHTIEINRIEKTLDQQAGARLWAAVANGRTRSKRPCPRRNASARRRYSGFGALRAIDCTKVPDVDQLRWQKLSRGDMTRIKDEHYRRLSQMASTHRKELLAQQNEQIVRQSIAWPGRDAGAGHARAQDGGAALCAARVAQAVCCMRMCLALVTPPARWRSRRQSARRPRLAWRRRAQADTTPARTPRLHAQLVMCGEQCRWDRDSAASYVAALHAAGRVCFA